MQRQTLTDGTGRWFDLDSAKSWENSTRWDGHNHVSVCAGKHERQWLYRTKSGLWVLHETSQWAGRFDTWVEITAQEAARWLSINGEDSHEACAEEFAALDMDAP